jgi:hypothetical protein
MISSLKVLQEIRPPAGDKYYPLRLSAKALVKLKKKTISKTTKNLILYILLKSFYS